MKDLDALKQELARDGRLKRLQAIADSTDGQRFADALDAQKIEQAAMVGKRYHQPPSHLSIHALYIEHPGLVGYRCVKIDNEYSFI